jgi:NTP pyrophosphatase (non-canonical NTP hydrolase)/S-adenosylmethionine/arginine decarboxylase-like enzyme
MEATNLQLERVVRQLRANCPWNARQGVHELLGALEAEVRELRQALRAGAVWEVREELGDTLFNLVAIAACFQEQSLFSLADVDRTVCDKMRSRHPYVFAGALDPGPEQARLLWAASKAKEARQRQASRLGVLIACEIYGVDGTKLSSAAWLKETLLQLCAAAGLQRGEAPGLIPIEAADASGGHLVGLAAPPTTLLLQAFPSHGLALLQGFTDGSVNPAELRQRITACFATEAVEMTLLERGHNSLEPMKEDSQ